MPDPRAIEHFIKVMQTRSFKQAADQLSVSQSSMTRSIAQLEKDLQLRLFNRTTRTVEPTDSARALIPRANEVLQTLASLEDEARLLAGGDLGTLRVGIIALATETLLADALAYLAKTHSELEVDVVVGSADVYRDLVTGECDVVIGDEANFQESAHASQLRMTSLRRDSIVLVHRKGHPYEGDFSSLVKQPLAIPSRYYNENRLFNSFRMRGGPEAPRYRLNSLASCIALTEQSDVVTLAPSSLIRKAPSKLVFCDDKSEHMGIEIHLALITVAAHTPTPAIRVFHEAIQETI